MARPRREEEEEAVLWGGEEEEDEERDEQRGGAGPGQTAAPSGGVVGQEGLRRLVDRVVWKRETFR